jgi:hypothetical protein
VSLLLRHGVLRRAVTLPALAVLLVLTAALLIPTALISGLIGLRPGGRARAARIAVFAIVYTAAEVGGVAWAAWLWLRAGFGRRLGAPRHQDAHYALLAKLLDVLYRVGSALFALHIDPPRSVAGDGAGTPALPATPGRPLLVLSRHAGPGDSFLLVHALLAFVHRRPRIVLKQTLVMDPLIDVVLGRLPHCFVAPGEGGGERATAQIRGLAATLGAADALLVFPEGGNFTWQRRIRAIASLRRRGLMRATARAQHLRNLLPPQPAGVFAAIDAAPHADLVFVAHTGLDHMQTVGQVWHGLPLTRTVEVTWWTVPTERVPAQEDARHRWLDDNWSRIDSWISRSQEADWIESG